jgi:hypothetical protein
MQVVYRIPRGIRTASPKNVFGFISSKLTPLKNFRTYSEAEFHEESEGGLKFRFLSTSTYQNAKEIWREAVLMPRVLVEAETRQKKAHT